MIARHVVIAVALVLGGCSLIVGDMVNPLEPDSVPDMQFELVGFNAHSGQLTELALVSDTGIVQARAIYEPLPEPDVLVTLRNAVAPNVRRVDFWSDLNENGSLDAPEPDAVDPTRTNFPDHMWRITLEPNGRGRFMHSTDFTDIVRDNPAQFVGGAARIMLTGTGDVVDQPAQFLVTDSADREVLYYYVGAIASDAIDLAIDGIIDVGEDYIVTIVIETDVARCVAVRGGSGGLLVEGSLSSLPECG